MVNDDIKCLDTEQEAEFIDALLERSLGRDIRYPIPPRHVAPAQLEEVVNRACDVADDADAVWETLAEDLIDDSDRDDIVARAVEESRPIGASNEPIQTDGGSNHDSSRDWELIGREVAEAVVSDITGGPIDHERTAVFKTRLQKGGRISVPEPELEALGLTPGDLLQIRLQKLGGDH